MSNNKRKSNNWIIISFLVIAATACVAVMARQKPIVTDTSAINAVGNKLSNYFYVVNTVDNTNLNMPRQHKQHIRDVQDTQLKKFYSKWRWKRNANLLDYESLVDAAWLPLHNNGVQKENYLSYWQALRPQIQQFYRRNVPFIEIKDPVVHFRCSDVPFNKSIQYHLTRASTVRWMARQIKERGYSQIIFLVCNQHRCFDQKNSCAQYTDFYQQIFNSEGINVSIQCNSIMQDFAMMVHSPLLVSLNASSFSFMAGIAKDPHNYISCNMGIEGQDKYFLQETADWNISYDIPLLHKYVVDYNDPSKVISLL